jgi:hypothetical protein
LELWWSCGREIGRRESELRDGWEIGVLGVGGDGEAQSCLEVVKRGEQG